MASIDREPVEQLAEQWRERWRRGEQFTADEYVARFPALANDIRELFDAIALMEQLKPAARDVTESGSVASAPTAPPSHGTPPERLGDFRILREIGRGGMGVVYEAEQESLGRRVALKVLPAGVAQRARFLERFRREARAVARLHHTNIVPVYGVGEENGACYFAMQFIQGQALDVVLDEIKRLRGVAPSATSHGAAATVAQSVAHSLLMDRFVERAPTAAPDAAPAEPAIAGPATAHRGDQSEHAGAGYYRRVAVLAVQVAEALAHAHSQGVLHRDIKPSNLLLDTHGTVWITDFGLAKADDRADLTQVGDIVGTVRYMAPERFEGKADGRSDVYAVGLTMYELLALRPAFDGTDRASLMGQITSHTPPPSLFALTPNLPRDLETIVHKAMAREPTARYASAADLADDLHCFLENRPIKARRISTVERFGRWCRRNPVVAGLTLTVFVLMACFAIGSTVAAFWLQKERDSARAAEEHARKEEEHARKEEEAKTEKLYQSYVAQARASRFSRQPGQRFASLDAIRDAVRIARERHMAAERFDELRTLAIACLTLPDWRTVRAWQAVPEWGTSWDWDPQHGRYARNDEQGNISVRRIEDDVEVAPLTYVPGECWMRFSPDGRFLMALGQELLRVWDLGNAERAIVLDMPSPKGMAFHPDGRHLAIGQADGSILVADLTAPKQPPPLLAQLGAGAVTSPAFDPAGKRLAVLQQGVVCILDARSGTVLSRIAESKPVANLTWHPSGDFLALLCAPRSIHIWDVGKQRLVSVLEGFTRGGNTMAFAPGGELLVSAGWEKKLRFWNWRTGQQVLRNAGNSTLHFSDDGRLLLYEGGSAKLAEVASGGEYRSFARQSRLGAELEYFESALHPDGRLLAIAMKDGVMLSDVQTGDELEFIRSDHLTRLAFAGPDGLMMNSGAGLQFWPLHRTAANAAELRLGPPQFWQSGDWLEVDCSKDGRVVAQSRLHQGGLILHHDRARRPVTLQPQADVRYISVSPDGAFVATGTHGRKGSIKLWDAKSGRFIRALNVGAQARPAFSPDSKRLAVQGTVGGRIVTIGSWEELADAGWEGRAAFSPDSRLLAVETGHGVIRLLDAATGRQKARLEDPNQDRADWLAFTPDGTRLVAVSGDGKAIHVWDLRLIRVQLAELGLDWDEPPFAALPPPAPSVPLHVTVVGAELASSPAAMLARELQTTSIRLLGNPLDADAYFQRGRIFLAMNQPVQALAEFNVVLALAPDHAFAHLLRGKLHQQQGRWQKAGDDFTWLLQRQPNDSESHRLRGECRVSLGDLAGAAADYRDWLQQSDQDAAVLDSVAWQLVAKSQERGRAELALPLTEKAVAQSPGTWYTVHTLGVTYYRLDRYKDAISTLERAAKLHGQPTAFELYFLAMCRHRLADAPGAKRDFDRAVRWQEQATVPPARIAELQSFRAEADALLNGPMQ